MAGSLPSAISMFVRTTRGLIFSTLGVAGLAIGVGCNGSFPPDSGGSDNPTEFSGIEGCATSFSDTDYNYGFDLPAQAELVRTKNESNSLTNSLWTFLESGSLVNVITRVEPVAAGSDLASIVSFSNDLSIAAGADLLSEEEVLLSNGGTAIQTTIRFDGLTTFRVQALSDTRLYTVEAVIEESARTTESDTLLNQIVASLCLGT